MLPERLASTVSEQPDFSEVCNPKPVFRYFCVVLELALFGLQDWCRAEATMCSCMKLCARVRLYRHKSVLHPFRGQSWYDCRDIALT